MGRTTNMLALSVVLFGFWEIKACPFVSLSIFWTRLIFVADGRAVEPPDILITTETTKNLILPRANKPKDEFTRHDPPVRWLALGDEHTAGPGAGTPYPEEVSDANRLCSRTEASYPAQLHQTYPWDMLQENQNVSFLACSGHRINNVVEQQLPKVSDDKKLRQDFAMMTVGANDAEFQHVFRICILGIQVPEVPEMGRDCEQQLQASLEIVGSQAFSVGLTKMYDGIYKKLDLDEPSYRCKTHCIPWIFDT
jgi:hypothetical protein